MTAPTGTAKTASARVRHLTSDHPPTAAYARVTFYDNSDIGEDAFTRVILSTTYDPDLSEGPCLKRQRPRLIGLKLEYHENRYPADEVRGRAIKYSEAIVEPRVFAVGQCWPTRPAFHSEPGIGGARVDGSSRGNDGVLNVFGKEHGDYPHVELAEEGPLAGVVLYDGQGFDSDQEMVRSNKRLLKAMTSGEGIRFLHQAEKDGEYCFAGWKRIAKLYEAHEPTDDGSARQVFKWLMIPSDSTGSPPGEATQQALEVSYVSALQEHDPAAFEGAGPRTRSRPSRPSVPDPFQDLMGFLHSLEGSQVVTVTGRPNSVLDVSEARVLVGTTRSPEGQRVPTDDVRKAFATLLQDGQIPVNVESLGHRSSFIGALLLLAPNTQVERDPFVIRLGEGLRPSAATEAASVDLLANPRRRMAQGHVADSRLRRAIEKYAVDSAMEHYGSLGYEVEDVGAFESYDLRCLKGGEELRVEVKGSTTPAVQVWLTANEVEHSRAFEATALYIVSEIEIDGSGRRPACSGGTRRVISNWVADDAHLQPVVYRYLVPPSDASESG